MIIIKIMVIWPETMKILSPLGSLKRHSDEKVQVSGGGLGDFWYSHVSLGLDSWASKTVGLAFIHLFDSRWYP